MRNNKLLCLFYRWFCHFDDDNYVNVPQLIRMLQKYDWTDDWYLGKPSIKAPLEILDREHMPVILFLYIQMYDKTFHVCDCWYLRHIQVH